MGTAIPSPASVGAPNARSSLGFGPVDFSSAPSTSGVFRHSVYAPSSLPFAFPSPSSAFPPLLPPLVSSGAVARSSIESSGFPWLLSLRSAYPSVFPHSGLPMVVSSAASSFAMSSILSSNVTSLLLPNSSSAPLTVVSSGSSLSAVVWSLPSVVSSVPSFVPMMSAPTQSFSHPLWPPCPSMSSTASLVPPSASLVSHSLAHTLSLAPPPAVSTVSVPSAEVSSGVGLSLMLGGLVQRL